MKENENILNKRPDWSARIETRMKELNLKKQQVATLIGVDRTLIGKYIRGEKTPPHTKWEKLATVLKTFPAWLEFGVGPKTFDHIEYSSINEKYIDSNQQDNVESSAFGNGRLKLFDLYKIPLLDWVQAREGMNAVNMFAKDCKSFVYYDEKVSPNSFALTVEGTAMIPNTAGVRGYYPNERVIIDPELDPQHGDCVIADAPHLSTPILRQYLKEAGIESLIAFDSRVKTIEISSEWKILGVVVGYMGGRAF